jgi:parallel beta-helix repeat protein
LKKTLGQQKILILGIILIFLGVCIIPSNAETIDTQSKMTTESDWFYVGGTGLENYSRIQDAIDDASGGDTVFVYSGLYNESILLNKSITLLGEDQDTTLIIGSNESEIVHIDDTSAVFKRFTVDSQENEFINGIYISDSWAVHITETTVRSCEYGILITSSESLTISNNTLQNCSSGIIGVIVGNVTVSGNIIDGNGEGSGIEIQAAMFKNYIRRNSITNNTVGINLVFTLFTIIQENNLLQNQQQAFFTTSFFSKWQQNYWNTSRILPKIIPGQFGGMIIHKWIPFLNFDWKPAKAPYDIQG